MTERAYITPTLQEAIREMANDGTLRTHSENCWEWHLSCAALFAVDQLDQAIRDRNQLYEQVQEFRQKCDPREDVVLCTAAEIHGFTFGVS